jgi:hypothetical protein
MKRGTARHPKVTHLRELLKSSLATAVGYLELLWHFTAEFCPQGDIGRFDDARIEAALGWTGRPGFLMDALRLSGWLEWSGTHRLVVHHWHDHADAAVIKRLQRKNLPFLSIQSPTDKVTGHRQTSAENGVLPEPEPEPMPEPVPKPEPVSITPDPASPVEILKPVEAKLHETGTAIHQRHPKGRGCSLAEVTRLLAAIAKRSPAAERIALLDTINENHREWCASEEWNSGFVKNLENWLAVTKGRFLERPAPPRRPMSKSERSLSEATQLFEAMNGGQK